MSTSTNRATLHASTSTTHTPPAHELAGTLRRIRAAARKNGASRREARLELLDRLERTLVRRKDDIAAAVARDFGHRSKHETLATEIFVVLNAIKHTKKYLRGWMAPEKRRTSWMFFPSRSRVVYQPLGVVGIISPWNYPVQLALTPLVGALAAGNHAMIKPSELVPETSEVLRDLIGQAFPPDLVSVVTGGPEVGEAFATLPFDHLVFTGSTRVGKLVMRAAAENLVPVTLELGGKSPTIVGADYDPAAAAEMIMAGKTLNAGQTCIAPDYVLLPAGARDAFVKACASAVAKLYPELENNPDYTSIITEKHHARLRHLLEDARERGARVVEITPGGAPLGAASRKMAPTLVLDATDEMACMQEEIFGPVLPVLTYSKLDDAIAYVNDHPRPLALYCFSNDRDAIDRVLSETISGGVSVNTTLLHGVQDDMPFGGVGASGMGHYHAREGFETFSKKKPIFHQSRIDTSTVMRPPYGETMNRMLRFLIRDP